MDSGHRQFRRIGSTGLALTAAAALVFPGSAAAEEKDIITAGHCTDKAANEKHGDDSSAPRATPTRTTDPDDDTDDTDDTDGVDGAESGDRPASLSLTGTLDLRGFDALAGLLCNTKNGAVDSLVRPIVEDDETTSPEMGDTPGSGFDENGSDDEITPESDTDEETTTATPDSLAEQSPAGPTGTPPGTGADGGGWGGVSPGRTPGALDVPPTSPEHESTFSAVPHDPRAAEDPNSTKASERLPLLLAVLSLVLVASALAHTWARRTLLR